MSRIAAQCVGTVLVIYVMMSRTNAQYCGRSGRITTVYCSQRKPAVLVETPVEVIPETRRLLGECFADINRCPIGSCIFSTQVKNYCFWWRKLRFVCHTYGIIKPVTTIETVDCGIFGSRDIERITECNCEVNTLINVNVSVKDSASGNPVPDVAVSVNDVNVNADSNSEFSTLISTLSRQVIVAVEDTSGNFISTVRVQSIPNGFPGPVNIVVLLVAIAPPILIQSNEARQLAISNDPEDIGKGVAMLTTVPGSFRNQDQSIFSGTVLCSINFIDVGNRNLEADIPGIFQTTQLGTFENSLLISDGLFALTFKDETGNWLLVDQIKITVRDDFLLWTLNTRNGLWELLPDINAPPLTAPTSAGRKKRQTSFSTFTVSVQNAEWVNIDKISGAPPCYFKARVFQSDGTTEINTSTTTDFQIQALGFNTSVTPQQRLRFYIPSTRSPANTCHAVQCPQVVNKNALAGFINMTSFESVPIGGVNIPVVATLTPLAINKYPSSIQSLLSPVQYEQASTNNDIFVNYIKTQTGPFYTEKSVCESSTIIQPAFHFVKSPLPSYESVPGNTQFCTARLGFDLNPNIVDALTNQSTSPIITAVSTWTENKNNFFYTDEKTIDVSSITSMPLSICITYRCSEGEILTTVHVLLKGPNITVPRGPDETPGSVPSLICRANCDQGDCVPGMQIGGIIGSFDAPPDSVLQGPAFYDGVNGKCAQESEQHLFALSFLCSPPRGLPNGNVQT